MNEYKITNQNHRAIIRVKAENESIAQSILNNLLKEIGIPSIKKEGWEIKLMQ